jgi:nucleoside-diphosphate-sugar epimerase
LLPLAVVQGHHVRALTRRPQPETAGIEWVTGDLSSPGDLCVGADAVIHIAGTINAADRAGFDAGNVAGTASIVAAAQAAGIKRFIHVSSLAAREPDLSAYGASKAAGEAVVRGSGLNAAIIRPPGVYGPGDRETLPVFQMVARGFAVLPGPGRFSLIEVGDVAAALLAVAACDYSGLVELDDGHGGYSHAELALAIGGAVGRRPWLIPLSTGVLGVAATVATALARVSGGTPMLSHDRARYLAHPDWVADPAVTMLRMRVRMAKDLATGLRETVAWYRRAGWLR